MAPDEPATMSQDMTATERAYLDAFVSEEAAPRTAAADQTWAAVQEQIHDRSVQDGPAAAPRHDAAAPRRRLAAWGAAMAVAAAVALWWIGAGRIEAWSSQGAGNVAEAAASYRTDAAHSGGRASIRTPPPTRPSRALAASPDLQPDPQPLDPAPLEETQAELPQMPVITPPVAPPQVRAKPRRQRRPPQRSAPMPTVPVEPAANVSAAEVRLLDRARAQARTGDATVALRLLDEHRHQFPNSVLAEERQVAKVRALCRAGRRDDARREADRFAGRHPRSHLVSTARRLCRAAPQQRGD